MHLCGDRGSASLTTTKHVIPSRRDVIPRVRYTDLAGGTQRRKIYRRTRVGFNASTKLSFRAGKSLHLFSYYIMDRISGYGFRPASRFSFNKNSRLSFFVKQGGDVQKLYGIEDQYVKLDLKSSLTDVDGSETLLFTISVFPKRTVKLHRSFFLRGGTHYKLFTKKSISFYANESLPFFSRKNIARELVEHNSTTGYWHLTPHEFLAPLHLMPKTNYFGTVRLEIRLRSLEKGGGPPMEIKNKFEV